MIYKLKLKDMNNQPHEVEAIGLNKLSTAYRAMKVTGVGEALQHMPDIASSSINEALSRDGGELDILVGTDLANFHPKYAANINHLVILRSIFSNGWTVMGHNENHLEFTGTEQGCRVNCCAARNIEFTNFFDTPLKSNMAGTKDIQFIDAITLSCTGYRIPV